MAPNVRRTWAPRGQTPILRQVTRSFKKVSAIAAVTVAPRRQRVGLYFSLHTRNFNAHRIIAFLRSLRRQLQRQIIVVWDRLTAHRGRLVQRFLARCNQVQVEFLPPYAPELNPTELLWSHLKMNPLANYAPTDVLQLRGVARRHLCRARKRYGLIRSFLYGTPLFFSPN